MSFRKIWPEHHISSNVNFIIILIQVPFLMSYYIIKIRMSIPT